MSPIRPWIFRFLANGSRAEEAFEADMARYLHHLSVEKRYRPATLKTYQTILSRCHPYFRDHPMQGWKTDTLRAVKNLLMHLRRLGLSAASARLYFSVIQGFYYFCTQKRLLCGQRTAARLLPKQLQRLPAALSVDQAAQLLAFQPRDWAEIRDKAILELLYSTGIRLSELTTISLDHVNWVDRNLMVLGKGGQSRLVPIGACAIQAIQMWLPERAKRVGPHRCLFISRSGKPLGARSIQKCVASSAKRQLHAHLHPHQLRHTFATHLLSSSQNLRAVQACLGHAKLTSTQRYTQLDYLHLTQVYDQCHPSQCRLKEEKH